MIGLSLMGETDVFDIRQNKLMESFKAHTHNTKSLSMDLMEQFAVSGASDGNIKVIKIKKII